MPSRIQPTKRAASAPSAMRWSYDSASGSSVRGRKLTVYVQGFGRRLLTPSMAACGQKTTGVKFVPPMPPWLEMGQRRLPFHRA